MKLWRVKGGKAKPVAAVVEGRNRGHRLAAEEGGAQVKDRRISIITDFTSENQLAARVQNPLIGQGSVREFSEDGKDNSHDTPAIKRSHLSQEMRRGRDTKNGFGSRVKRPQFMLHVVILVWLGFIAVMIVLYQVQTITLKVLMLSLVGQTGVLLFLSGKSYVVQLALKKSSLLRKLVRFCLCILAFAPVADMVTDGLAAVNFYVNAANNTPTWFFPFSVAVMALSFRGAAILKYYTALLVVPGKSIFALLDSVGEHWFPEWLYGLLPDFITDAADKKEPGKFYLIYVPLMFVPGMPYYCRSHSLYHGYDSCTTDRDRAEWLGAYESEVRNDANVTKYLKEHPAPLNPLLSPAVALRVYLAGLCAEVVILPLSVAVGPTVVFYECCRAVPEIWHGKTTRPADQPWQDKQVLIMIFLFQALDGIAEALPQSGLQVAAFFKGILPGTLFYPSLALSIFNTLKCSWTFWEHRYFILFVVEHAAGVLSQPTAGAFVKDCTSLNLNSHELNKGDCKVIAGAVTKARALKKLDISTNHLGPEGAKAFAGGLPKCKALIMLDLSNNQIGGHGGEPGVHALAKGLDGNKYIQELNVASNGFDAECADILAPVLKTMTALIKITWGDGEKVYTVDASQETLDLSGRDLQSHDAQIVAAMLPKCMALTCLDVSGNIDKYSRDGPAFAKHMAGGIKDHPALTYVNLANNSLHAEGAKAVADVLPQCKALTSISFDGTGYNAKTVKLESSMVEVDLSSKGLGLGGAQITAEFLPKMTALIKFIFSGDKYNAPPVTLETGMTEVDISNKQLGASSAIMAAAFLPKMTALMNLDISGNHIPRDILDQMKSDNPRVSIKNL